MSWCEGSLDEFLLAQKWSISWSVGLSITYQPYESHYLAVELFCETWENENGKKSTYMIMDWSDRRKGKKMKQFLCSCRVCGLKVGQELNYAIAKKPKQPWFYSLTFLSICIWK